MCVEDRSSWQLEHHERGESQAIYCVHETRLQLTLLVAVAAWDYCFSLVPLIRFHKRKPTRWEHEYRFSPPQITSNHRLSRRQPRRFSERRPTPPNVFKTNHNGNTTTKSPSPSQRNHPSETLFHASLSLSLPDYTFPYHHFALFPHKRVTGWDEGRSRCSPIRSHVKQGDWLRCSRSTFKRGNTAARAKGVHQPSVSNQVVSFDVQMSIISAKQKPSMGGPDCDYRPPSRFHPWCTPPIPSQNSIGA